MHNQTPIYSIRNFSFRYPFSNSHMQLKGNIDIYPGETVLITGKSGIGKSTLLYALKGLIPHHIYGHISGELLFFGKDITTLNQSKIALLMQNPNSQIITRTVLEEIAFGLENLSLTPDEIIKKTKHYAHMFQIEHLLDKKTDELSGGEKQQVNFIAILITNPDVILLDEPTAFLDPLSSKRFIDTFNRITQDKTIIIIEHNLSYLKNKITKYINIDDQGNFYEDSLTNIEWDYQPYPIKYKPLTHTPLLEIKNYPLSNNSAIQNFTIFRGDILGIIGKNGIGKTTLLKNLALLIDKPGNSIYYDGVDIRKLGWRNYFSKVALLWQNPENHFLFNRVIDEVNHDQSFLEKMNLGHLGLQNPFTLSEGQKRRLSLAMVWQLDRELYLLDEPSFGQDNINKQLLIDLIGEMCQMGKTFVIISHDMPFLAALNARIHELTSTGLKDCN